MFVRELVRLHTEISKTEVNRLAIWQQLAEVEDEDKLKALIATDQQLSNLLDEQEQMFIKVAKSAEEEEQKWH